MLTVATAAHAVALSIGEPEAIPPPRPPIEIAFQRPPQRAPEQLSRLPERAPKWSRALSDEARDMTPLAATQQLRAETRPPMPGAWNATILVGTHHKTGTVLLAKVFRVAAKMFSVPRHKNNYTACADLFATHARGVCIDEHVNANSMREWLRPQQPFIHAVRHPLEMCISAYIYHKQGAEPWLLKPMPDLGGLNLMQHYQALPPVDGVRFECRRMVTELVESAVLYNRTHRRHNVLSIRFEEFDRDFDDTFTRIFSFLDSGAALPSLLKEAAQYDLKRAQPGDDKHVSASDEKAPLRAHVLGDALLRDVIESVSTLLGYASGPLASANQLCDQLRALCATTNVRFLQWCVSGQVPHGHIAALPECGEKTPKAPNLGPVAMRLSGTDEW